MVKVVRWQLFGMIKCAAVLDLLMSEKSRHPATDHRCKQTQHMKPATAAAAGKA